jgi:hypothetical protein
MPTVAARTMFSEGERGEADMEVVAVSVGKGSEIQGAIVMFFVG